MTSNKILELERDLAVSTLRWVRMMATDRPSALACEAIEKACKYALAELDPQPPKQEIDS